MRTTAAFVFNALCSIRIVQMRLLSGFRHYRLPTTVSQLLGIVAQLRLNFLRCEMKSKSSTGTS